MLPHSYRTELEIEDAGNFWHLRSKLYRKYYTESEGPKTGDCYLKKDRVLWLINTIKDIPVFLMQRGEKAICNGEYKKDLIVLSFASSDDRCEIGFVELISNDIFGCKSMYIDYDKSKPFDENDSLYKFVDQLSELLSEEEKAQITPDFNYSDTFKLTYGQWR